MICRWIQYFGDYCFTTECGRVQGINIRPKKKTCMCGRKIERYIQNQNGMSKVNGVSVKNGIAYYHTS